MCQEILMINDMGKCTENSAWMHIKLCMILELIHSNE
jgi:uncharacterized membrane protein